ncbi:hypothetical protein DVK00_06545 [Haloarcula sp. Atlit-47R]|nr:hypothetical protein DVK00_06545 [Haloarcula sp. Atlit-47R]
MRAKATTSSTSRSRATPATNSAIKASNSSAAFTVIERSNTTSRTKYRSAAAANRTPSAYRSLPLSIPKRIKRTLTSLRRDINPRPDSTTSLSDSLRHAATNHGVAC